MSETDSKATGKPTPVPTNKVIFGSVAGAATVIIVYAINTYILIDNKLPAEISSALVVVISFL